MRAVLVMLAAMGVAPAIAADTASIGRFELAPADTGFVRLDTETGATTHCAEDGGIWVCEPLVTDSALTARVDALAAEVARMADAIAAMPVAAAATGERVDALAAEIGALGARVDALSEAASPQSVAVALEPVQAAVTPDAAPAGLLAEVVDRFLAFVAALKHG